LLIAAKILVTLVTLGYSVLPAMFDPNQTHVTNPSFPGGARFHIVWQLSSYFKTALLALYLIWTAGTQKGRLWIAAILVFCAYLGFWTAVVTRGMYAGTLPARAMRRQTSNRTAPA
jgi:hypothetical protein